MKKLLVLSLIYLLSSSKIWGQCPSQTCTFAALEICQQATYNIVSTIGNYSNQVPAIDPYAPCAGGTCNGGIYEYGDFAFRLSRPDFTNKCTPFVLFIHGGGFSQNDYSQFNALCDELAKRGIAAAAINYRLTAWDCVGCLETCTIGGGLIGRSKAFKQSGYKVMQDSRAALRYFMEYADDFNINPQKVFVAGWSAGGAAALGLAYMTQAEADVTWAHSASLGAISDPITTASTCDATYTIRGVITQSTGTIDLTDIDLTDNKPTLMFHCENDGLANINQGFYGISCGNIIPLSGSQIIFNKLQEYFNSSDPLAKTRVEFYKKATGGHSIDAFPVGFRAERIACFVRDITSNTNLNIFTEGANQYTYTSGTPILAPTCICSTSPPALGLYNSQVLIYPNPATMGITVSIEESIASVQIKDLVGFEVINRIGEFKQSTEMKIDVSGLKDGQYLVVVTSKDGHTHFGQFLKQ
jgi:dienelactone hydrolase